MRSSFTYRCPCCAFESYTPERPDEPHLCSLKRSDVRCGRPMQRVLNPSDQEASTDGR